MLKSNTSALKVPQITRLAADTIERWPTAHCTGLAPGLPGAVDESGRVLTVRPTTLQPATLVAAILNNWLPLENNVISEVQQ